MTRLIAITPADNVASRRIAEKCGFIHVGAPREGPSDVLMEWRVRREGLVSHLSPRSDLPLECLSVPDATVQALPTKDREFDLDYVQPAGMLERTVLKQGGSETVAFKGTGRAGGTQGRDDLHGARFSIRSCCINCVRASKSWPGRASKS